MDAHDLEGAGAAIHQLAMQCMNAGLPGEVLAYPFHVRTLKNLLAATQSIGRTRVILWVLMAHAKRLNHSEKWVCDEMDFEAYVAAAVSDDIPKSWQRFLLADLECHEQIDNGLLDQYNERLTRFD